MLPGTGAQSLVPAPQRQGSLLKSRALMYLVHGQGLLGWCHGQPEGSTPRATSLCHKIKYLTKQSYRVTPGNSSANPGVGS